MTDRLPASYEGGGCVRIGERLLDFRFKGKDPAKNKGDGYGGVMPRAARQLIAEGMDPGTLVHLTRDGTVVFAEDLTLSHWAGLRFEERANDHRGLRATSYRPPQADRERARDRGLEGPRPSLDRSSPAGPSPAL